MEAWKDIPGYEGLYRVSDKGRVYSIVTKKILKHFISSNGYCVVRLYKNGSTQNYKVHRLVLIVFKPKGLFDGNYCNHKDSNKQNNTVQNLEWVTQRENIIYGFMQGNTHSTKKRKVYKVDKETDEILETYDSIAEAARDNNIIKQEIGHCCQGKVKSYYGYKWQYAA